MATEITYNICDGAAWAASTAVVVGDRRLTASGNLIDCVKAGTTGSTVPTFTVIDDEVTDNTAVWVYRVLQDYAKLSALVADINVGISNQLVTDDENWLIQIWHKKNGAYAETVTSDFSFSEACDATRRVIIRPAVGEGWKDGYVRGVDRLAYDENYGAAISVDGAVFAVNFTTNTDFCEVHDLQMVTTNANAKGFKGSLSTNLISGCLAQQHAGIATTVRVFEGQNVQIHNCIGVTLTTTAGAVFSCDLSSNVANCKAIFAGGGTPATGQRGFTLTNVSVRTMNCVGVNNDTDFADAVSTATEADGNVSSDTSANTAFAGQTGTIVNGTNLVKSFANSTTYDCEPGPGSSALTISTGETNFTFTSNTDIFGTSRVLTTSNLRGPINTATPALDVDDTLIIKFVTLGQTTGNNTGDSLADAWQTWEDARDNYAPGMHMHVTTANSSFQQSSDISLNNDDTTGVLPIIWEGYANTPGDGGYCTFTHTSTTQLNFQDGSYATNFQISGAVSANMIAITDLTHLNNFRVHNTRTTTSGGAISCTDHGNLTNSYIRTDGIYTAITLYRCTTSNIIVECTNKDGSGINVRGAFRSNQVNNVLVFNTGGNDGTGRGIRFEDGDTNNSQHAENVTIDGFGTGLWIEELEAFASSTFGHDIQNFVISNCGIGIDNVQGSIGKFGALWLDHIAFYNNTTNITNTSVNWIVQNEITLDKNPYVNVSTADFSPNQFTFGGELLREARIHGAEQGTINNLTVGAIGVATGDDYSLKFLGGFTDGVDRSTYTFDTTKFGDIDPSEIILAVMARGSSPSISSITVDSNTANNVITIGNASIAAHYQYSHSTLGSLNDIVVNWGATVLRMSLGVYSLKNMSLTASETQSNTDAAIAKTIKVNIDAGGIGLSSIMYTNNDNNTDWVGFQEDLDFNPEGDIQHSSASGFFETAQVNLIVTANNATKGENVAYVTSSWTPI